MKLAVLAGASTLVALCGPAEAKGRPRNVVIFVADGLRPGSLNPTDAPTLVRLQKEGVFFSNSHSLYPTLTTANASAIATGHLLGDTGDFANTIYTGSHVINSGTPFIEDDEVLAELDAHAGGNYLGEKSLLALARAHGFRTVNRATRRSAPTSTRRLATASSDLPVVPAGRARGR
jgi:arylsulfatase A-like enzyme